MSDGATIGAASTSVQPTSSNGAVRTARPATNAAVDLAAPDRRVA
jgi:hypothetical protein